MFCRNEYLFYLVGIDLEEIVNNSEIRTLLFDLPAGTEEVEIFGTIFT